MKATMTPPEILDRMRVPENPNVYLIGRKAMRLTFLSQQQRALNLVWALHQTQGLREKEVTVVGAGLAGLTAAFAACKLGAKVTLIESKRLPLHLQRGCQLRFVHPHILDWPNEGSANPLTELPCMNWGGDMAAGVCDTILYEWATVESEVYKFYGYELRRISIQGNRPLVFAEGDYDNYEQDCDILILAIGFGLESSISSVPFLSYWENDNFGRPVITGPTPRRYLVSGCGDGGLIDAIRLRLNAFDHSLFFHHLSQLDGLEEIKNCLPGIDQMVANRIKDDPLIQGEIALQLLKAQKLGGASFNETRIKKRIEIDIQGRLLEEAYRGLKIPDSLTNLFEKTLGFRDDTVVFLNSPATSPLSLGSSILNRFIVFLLRKFGGLRYRAGEVKVLSSVPGQPIRVTFKHEQFPAEELEIHEMVVRHGPIPVIDRLFPQHIADACRPDAADLNDPTRDCQYDKANYFEDSELWRRNEMVKVRHAIANSPLAAATYTPLQYDRFGIQVVEQDNTYKINYTLRELHVAQTKDEIKPYNGIEFLVEKKGKQKKSAAAIIKTKVKTRRKFGTDIIVCGIGIQNIGFPPGSALKGAGTLGCFVRLDSGKEGFLTTASAVGGSEAVIGDHISVITGKTPAEPTVIGKLKYLSLPVPSSPRSSLVAGTVLLNRYEAAIVTVETKFEADFKHADPNALSFTSAFQLSPGLDVRYLKKQKEVLMVGAVSGLRRGRIESFLTSTRVYGWGEQYWYEGLFLIKSTDSDKKPFTTEGDSGALVVLTDGTALGLVIAGNDESTYVCPIAPILEDYKCTLITTDEHA